MGVYFELTKKDNHPCKRKDLAAKLRSIGLITIGDDKYDFSVPNGSLHICEQRKIDKGDIASIRLSWVFKKPDLSALIYLAEKLQADLTYNDIVINAENLDMVMKGFTNDANAIIGMIGRAKSD